MDETEQGENDVRCDDDVGGGSGATGASGTGADDATEERRVSMKENEKQQLDSLLLELQRIDDKNRQVATCSDDVTPTNDVNTEDADDISENDAEVTVAMTSPAPDLRIDEPPPAADVTSSDPFDDVINSIVSDLQEFAQNPAVTSLGDVTSARTKKRRARTRDSDYLYSQVVGHRRKFESDPDLHNFRPAPGSGFHSLNRAAPDRRYFSLSKYERAESVDRAHARETSEKKRSVSFNDVVMEMNASHDDSAHWVTTQDDRDECSATEQTCVKTALLTDDTYANINDVMAPSMDDDVISVASEDELYTSGNETEEEEGVNAHTTSGVAGMTPFKPLRVRKFVRLRTALLVAAWTVMVSEQPTGNPKTRKIFQSFDQLIMCHMIPHPGLEAAGTCLTLCVVFICFF